jgi:predicted dehydrogenase
MTALRIGLIGTGYIGRSHAIALSAVGTVFDEIEAPVLELVADVDDARAAAARRALSFRRATSDWRALVADPAVDIVDVCTPNHLHREMALAALAAGKHVYCEKPLALSAAEAAEMAEAANRAGVTHLVGFNFPCNPILQTVREMLSAGELGELIGFRGRYLEDYLADPAVPFSWRCERRLAGPGALADLGSHLINLGHVLVGDLPRVNASLHTVIGERVEPASGKRRRVENEDVAYALVEFGNGVPGSFEISRVAAGYKHGLALRIFGTRGSVSYDQERFNELKVYRHDDPAGRRGFRTILAGPEHSDYRPFCPAPGHGLGINDLKIIETRNLLRAIAAGERVQPDFHEGARVQYVMDMLERSSAERAWVELAPRSSRPSPKGRAA